MEGGRAKSAGQVRPDDISRTSPPPDQTALDAGQTAITTGTIIGRLR